MMEQEVVSQFGSVFAVGASVPFGTRGLVHVWGRNDMASRQDLGIVWTVKDPDGAIVEQYFDWSYGHGPGDDHEFLGDRFDINKPGTWTIVVDLLMNYASPVVVDSYSGVLCVVTEEIFAGTITKKELEYDSVRGDIPVY
ncbi:hypothetical protein ES703_123793 [subsurface metagenome]